MQSRVEKCPSDFRVALRRVYSFRFLMRTSCGLAWGNQRQAGRVSAALKCWSLWGVRARQVMNPPGLPWNNGGVSKGQSISTAQQCPQIHHCRWGSPPALHPSVCQTSVSTKTWSEMLWGTCRAVGPAINPDKCLCHGEILKGGHVGPQPHC